MSKNKPLSLHVPEPNARPGDKPDFSYLDLSAAGASQRPEVDCDAASIRSHAYELIRVLDDDGQAVGPWAIELDKDSLIKGLRAMQKPVLLTTECYSPSVREKLQYTFNAEVKKPSPVRTGWL